MMAEALAGGIVFEKASCAARKKANREEKRRAAGAPFLLAGS
jgi:hypothetical protein